MSKKFSVIIEPSAFVGNITVNPSKSHLHRLLICAALSDKESFIDCANTDAEDIKATIGCLSALGAKIEYCKSGFEVSPLKCDKLPARCILPCGESGTTLRFMLPVASALGVSGEFHLGGRLPQRPMAPLENELTKAGVLIYRPKPDVICIKGKLSSGGFHLPGNISSQYISGLLLALPLLNTDSTLTVWEPVESKNYISMTLETLKSFAVNITECSNCYNIPGRLSFQSPLNLSCEGDWSNSAFWAVAAAMKGTHMQLKGLNKTSCQGDRQITAILEQVGARLHWDKDILVISEGERQAIEVDASNIPDLIPPLAALAAISEGCTMIKNASRLRFKESDRLSSIRNCLSALGALVSETPDGLVIQGVPHLKGGIVDSYGDHRIAMMAAVASSACTEPVTIKNAHAVNKSYPDFFTKLAEIGKNLEVHYE